MAYNMQKLKQFVQYGQLQLAHLDENNKTAKMQISQLQLKTNQLNKNQRIYKLVSKLSWQQKYQWVNTRRLKANQFFKNSLIKQALQCYLQSLIGLQLNDSDVVRNQQVKLQLKFPILLNISSCFYKLKNFENGVQICNQILNDQKGKQYIPALYKKAYFLYQLGQYNKAKQITIHIYKRIQKGDINKKISKKDIQQLLSNILSKTKEQRKIYQRIFDQEQWNSNTSKKQYSEDMILVYDENVLKRSLIWLRDLFECCLRKKPKSNIQEDQEQNVNFLKDKSR